MKSELNAESGGGVSSTDLLGVNVIITESFSDEISECLRKHGVDLDDWDYAVFGPPEMVRLAKNDDGREYLEPTKWTYERILTGCCDNTWYLVNINGKEYALGMAYHA